MSVTRELKPKDIHLFMIKRGRHIWVLFHPFLCSSISVTDSKSYYDAMDPNNMSIPLRLRGKRDVVFGNLLEIFKFHDR